MTERLVTRKRVENPTPWPDHWTVRFTWESPLGTMQAREHEFQVSNSRTWYTFLKYVHNRQNNQEWIDAVASDGFFSCRPGRVVKIRVRKPLPTASRNAKAVET